LPNKFVNFGRCENSNRRTENLKHGKRHYEANPSKDFEKRMLRKCFNCHSPNHLSNNCLKVKKESEHAIPLNSEVQICSVITQKDLHLKDETIYALMGTGSSDSLILEDASTKIVD
ncbi:hypothetical protein NPIL_481291, partial [Nephila pilipes]